MSDANDQASQSNPNDPFARYVPLLELLSIRPVSCEEGRAEFEMIVEDKHLRTLGILHGGVVTTLLDTALGMAAGSVAPEAHFVVTVQLNANFIRPAWNGETLLASGAIKHSGRQTAVSVGEIRTADDVLVATGSGTFLYLPLPADGAQQFERRE